MRELRARVLVRMNCLFGCLRVIIKLNKVFGVKIISRFAQSLGSTPDCVSCQPPFPIRSFYSNRKRLPIVISEVCAAIRWRYKKNKREWGMDLGAHMTYANRIYSDYTFNRKQFRRKRENVLLMLSL